MKIVLRSDVAGIGRKGDVRDVADGYARNFLLPKGLAFKATPGAEAQAEGMRRSRAMRSAAERADAVAIADVLAGSSIEVSAKAGAGGKLFGSIGASDIANAISAQTPATVDRRQVVLDEPIKALGAHTVKVHLHPEIDATVSVNVVAV
jgi:large subunit ribosomal protein L9